MIVLEFTEQLHFVVFICTREKQNQGLVLDYDLEIVQ